LAVTSARVASSRASRRIAYFTFMLALTVKAGLVMIS